MNRNHKLAGIIIAMVMIIGAGAVLYPTGAPAGYTGSPADSKTCTECHGGTASTVTEWITSNIPAGGYVPSATYQITVSNKLNGSGKYGFEISPQSSSGALMGTLSAGTNTKIVGTKYLTHSNASASQKEWTFNWTAPAAGAGAVTFYAAFAQGKPGQVSKSSYTVQEMVTTAMPAPEKNVISLYPNPAHGYTKLSLAGDAYSEVRTVSIYSPNGRCMKIIEASGLRNDGGVIDLSHLKSGLYILIIETQNEKLSAKLMVQ